MITTFYPPYNFGGDGIFVHSLSNELARLGHHVEVIHCIDSYRLLAGGTTANSVGDHPNVEVHGLKSMIGSLSPIATQQTGHPLFKSKRIKEILGKGFDVIHFHNISLVGGPKILEYGKGIKLFTMHDYWLVCPTHVLFKFNSRPCIAKNCFLCSLSYKRPPQLWRYTGMLEQAAKHVHTIISLGRFSRDKHIKLDIEVPIEYLPPFISMEDFVSNRDELSFGDKLTYPFFLFVGRLEKLKGLQTIIPVFKEYQRARLLIAGNGKYERKLREIAGESKNIEFLGYVAHNKLSPLYKKAVALIIPSLCYEIVPFVMLEAFSQSLPVIVRDIGAMPEFVEASGGGILFESDEELVEALDKLLENPGYRTDLGIKAYQAYKSNWTAEAHLKNYFGMIRRLSTSISK
jgi:glycosyltransferase involved in cell wall biosynthesis